MKYFVLISYIVLLLIIFFGIPDRVLYSQDVIGFTPFILIFFFQSFLLYCLLKSFNAAPKFTIGCVALSVLVIGPCYGLYEGHRAEADLKENGSLTNGIVYKKWQRKSEWLLRCQYSVNGNVYSTFTEKDKDNIYKVGDTVTVIYVKDFPQKSRIKKLE
jgi:hypothetical protein